jgi:hypothetical protein
MNRATADNQSAQAEGEGLEPTKEWVKDLIDEIIVEEFASPDLKLVWLDEDEADPKGLEAVLEGRVKLGAVTLNEMRDALGLDPYANPAADRPMVLTATGYVPIEAGASSPVGVTRGSMLPLRPNEVLGKYSPDQPRVPAGNTNGGQWTRVDGDGVSGGLSDRSDANNGAKPDTIAQPVQYAALDTGARTDASGNSGASASSTGIEYAAAPIVVRPGAVTGVPIIDETTKKLALILSGVVDKIGPMPGLSPSQYGTMIHTEFAAEVRAAQIPGIDIVDVERTFGLDPGAAYGAKDSVRTDVILRDDDGNIIAIYDVKTGGASLDPARVDRLRARTHTTTETYMIEMNITRGPIFRYVTWSRVCGSII